MNMFEDNFYRMSKEELINLNNRINEIINELGSMGLDGNYLGDIDEERCGLIGYIEENYDLNDNEKELLGL
jgi:hypothetical protein